MAPKIVIISLKDIEPFKERLAAWFPSLPGLFTLGDLNLLRLPLTGLFCSRKCPGDAILKAYDLARELREKETPVICGFHTPVEKDMLEILLKGKGPIVICPARGLEKMRIPKEWNRAIHQGQLVLASMFSPNIQRATSETARQRNILVVALANECRFIHIEPGGETERVAGLFTMKFVK